MRRTLVTAADPITIQVTRNSPRTGSLAAGKGCFTLRTVASTAERKFPAAFWYAWLRRRRWEVCAWAWVKRK